MQQRYTNTITDVVQFANKINATQNITCRFWISINVLFLNFGFSLTTPLA